VKMNSGTQPALYALACFLLASASYSDFYTITDLGPLAEANDISETGLITGTGSGLHAYSWDSGIAMDVHDAAAGDWSRGFGINDSGIIVGPSRLGAVIYDGSQIITFGGTLVRAFDVNNAGQVLALDFFNNPDPTGSDIYTAVIWENGTVTQIAEVPEWVALYDTVEAMDINNQGQVVGPFGLYDPVNGVQDITPPGTPELNPLAINENGQIAGYAYFDISPGDGEYHAFFLENGTFLDLGTLGGTESAAQGINDDGQVVGFAANASGSNAAFIWDDGVLTDLNLLISPASGWTLTEARGINNAGEIVGLGTIGGETHGFLLSIIPEPSTVSFMACALICIAILRGSITRRWSLQRGAGRFGE